MQEEVQFAVLPITLPILAGFLLTYAAIADPSALWIQVLSFLPPLSPVPMPARLALGVVSWWEMPLAVLITLLAVYGTARLSWRAALRLRAE